MHRLDLTTSGHSVTSGAAGLVGQTATGGLSSSGGDPEVLMESSSTFRYLALLRDGVDNSLGQRRKILLLKTVSAG